MKKFTIKSLSMKDFKGVTAQQFHDFDKTITIEGDNYTGKTTIAEGIIFGLYGVDLQGSSRTDALVSNQMKRGKCEVVVVVETDEGEFKITRSATRTKKAVKIDKVEVSQKEVTEIVGELDSFIIAYLPTHILGYKDKDAREFFMQFVDEVEPGDVLAELGGFAEALEGLELGNIEELKKELRASNKEWERDLDFLDGRIASIDQTLKQETSPLIDTSGLEQQIKDLEAAIYDDLEKPQLKDVSELKEELTQQHEKMMNIKIDAPVYEEEYNAEQEINEKILALNIPDAPPLHNTDVIEWEIKQLRKDYDKLTTKSLSIGTVCPTCNQEIKDQTEIENHKTEINKELNEVIQKGKAFKISLERLTKENEVMNEQYKKDVEAYEAEKDSLTHELKAARLDCSFIKQNNEKIKMKYESDLNNSRESSNNEYGRILKELAAIENENEQTLISFQKDKIQKRNEIKESISALRFQLNDINASNQSHHLISQNIKTAKTDKTKFQSDIRKSNESIEKNKASLEALNEYVGEYAKMQAGQLNKYFNKVSIQLFEVTKTTGEMKPKFKLLYDEKTIDVLSLSERIRLGLEVSNFIKVATNTSYPTFIDNAESITHYDKSPGQLFTATVVKDKALSIESI